MLAPLTPTIGRAVEHRRVVDALASTRLVTIVGPGGVGKTRLAVDVARDVASARTRSSVFVELARVTEPADVVATIAAALDLRPGAGDRLRDLDGAGSLDALLVLDNCEHVIDTVAMVVPRLLGHGEHLRVLGTSREPLSVAGEHVVTVAPLRTTGADSPAAELFRQRAVAAAPSDELDDALIAEVVARVDGLPLAVEMAAARLRTMSLAELSRSIGRDLDLLASSRRDVDERHRTLRDLLAWSERLLDEELRSALFAFTVFAGPVAAGDLPAVIDTDRATDVMARLVDRSLVFPVPTRGGTRFAALETVRSYGREQLRLAGTHEALRRRHAEWFLDAATEIDTDLRGPNEAAAIARFRDILDELRAAVRWSLANDLDVAASLVDHTYVAGRTLLVAETVSWAADVAAHLPIDHPGVRRVRSALAGGLSTLGRLDEATGVAEDLLADGEPTVDVLYALEGLGDATLYQGHLDDCIRVGHLVHRLAADAGDTLYADFGTIEAGLALAYDGRRDEALALLAGGPMSSAPSAAAWFEYVRGEAILDQDPPAALVHLERAEQVARAVGHRYLLEVAMLSVTTLKARIGEVGESIGRFIELLDHFGVGGDPGHLVTTLRNLVVLLVRLDDHRAAAALFGAVAEHPASPSYGVEAERLGAAAAVCREALGNPEFERFAAIGRAQTLDESVAAAHLALTSPATTTPPGLDDAAEGVSTAAANLPSAELVAEGETWRVSFAGRTVRVRDMKGVGDLAVLVGRPGAEVHAIELMGGRDVGGSAGPVLDDQARRAYQERIGELQRDIDEAGADHDHRRAELAEVELDALVEQLSEAFGLGGRSRTTGSSAERARTAVTYRLRSAIRKLGELHPDLGRHLENAVRTGTWCSYRPEGDVIWTVEPQRLTM